MGNYIKFFVLMGIVFTLITTSELAAPVNAASILDGQWAKASDRRQRSRQGSPGRPRRRDGDQPVGQIAVGDEGGCTRRTAEPATRTEFQAPSRQTANRETA